MPRRTAAHTVAVAAHPWVRLIENPANVFLSPAWNQGIRANRRSVCAAAQSRHRMVEGDARGLRRRWRARNPRAGIVGPMVRNTDGSVYPSGRPLPSVIDALGHAFLGPFAPGNGSLGATTCRAGIGRRSAQVDWVSGCCMLIPAQGVRRSGHARRVVPSLWRRAGHGHPSPRVRLERLVHARGRDPPRARCIDRPFSPDDADALREHLPLLPQTPRRRMAETHASARLDGASPPG